MARVLVKKNIARAIKKAAQDGSEPPDDKLPPGHMRLYSFYTPALEAGPYAVIAQQTIKAANQSDLNVWNYLGTDSTPPVTVLRQNFNVIAPQFSLDPKLINTYYPPSGHQDEGRILPHIVFNDPHVPWMRRAGVFYPFLEAPFDPEPISGDPRSMVPWMAVLVFSPDELLVNDNDAVATGLKQIKSYEPTKLPANGAFEMTVGDYLTKIPKRRIYYEAAGIEDLQDSTEVTSIIFPTKGLIQQMLGTKDQSDILKSHKFLAHVRHINTIGFPDAGVEEEGYYSVVISSRTGDVEATSQKPQIVHLVSLEHYDSTVNSPDAAFGGLADSDRVGLVSLVSWTYNCIPEVVDFAATMQKLDQLKQPLRPPDPVLDVLKQGIPKQPTRALQDAASILHDRLYQSYTISRWRTASGEESTAFNRGPFVGAPTPAVPASDKLSWPVLSMTGKDYQIFDSSIGMMDVTYSSAWNLGRIAAISDTPFNAALLRFRSLVYNKSASNTRKLINGIVPSKDILAETASILDRAAEVTPEKFKGSVQRLTPHCVDPVAPGLTNPSVAPIFTKAIRQTVDLLSSVSNGQAIYNDYHLEKAMNSDWELIHNWLSDCLYFKNIPAHYLFPDPSHIKGPPQASTTPSLPNTAPEALRFFYIDHSWLDAFLDGALSCCNHLEPKFDSTRMRVKDVYNFYLSQPIHGLEKKVPPIPRYGFVIRSLAVKATPDLKITVTCWKFDPSTTTWSPDTKDGRRDPVVQLTKMDDFTILCLLDCLPEEIYEIRIAQPPHQQRFTMGESVLKENNYVPNLRVRMAYTSSTTTGIDEDGSWPFLTGPDAPTDEATYYNVKTRMINPAAIANSVQNALVNSSQFPKLYTDPVANSCLLGLELNDPCWTLIITGDKPTRNTDFDPWTRKLWTGPDTATAHDGKAVLSESDLPAQPLIYPIDTKVVATSTEYTSDIIKPPPGLVQPPRLHSSRIVPRTPPEPVDPYRATVPKLGKNIVSGAFDTIAAQFKLMIHVDYRPPPPTPLMVQNNITYAPMDYLPSDATFLYDIIIDIRRSNPDIDPSLDLLQLDIELPESDGIDKLPGGRLTREPLLPKGGYNGPGVRMVNNVRFVPTLFSDLDENQLPIQGISLSPRSGNSMATIPLKGDGRTIEASVRLAQCPIAPIVNKVSQAAIAHVDGSTSTEFAGLCKITLRETYLVNGRTRIAQTTGDIIPGGPVPLVALKRAKMGDNPSS